MEKVHDELEEAKQEIDNLKTQLQEKSESYKSVKQSQTLQLMKLQDANSLIDKQNQELAEKSEEIFSIKQLNEQLKSKISDKESAITHLNSAIDKLRLDSNEKLKRCEEEYNRLLAALDEASEKERDQEKKISELEGENERLKCLLSVKEEKRCEDSGRSVREGNGSVELRKGDDILEEIEEEKRKVEEQLKWKMEQFSHLEEAHEKLRKKFNENKREWENEKSSLLDEISSLETRLFETSPSASGAVFNQLDTCKQALENEEKKTKNLDDDDVTSLRHSLRVQEMMYKDLEYQARQLEQENLEILASLKELQEAQIQMASTPNSSLARMRSKLKSLEQKHKECDNKLHTKEAEWSSKVDKLTQELNDCRFTLKLRDEVVDKLRAELETCNSSLTDLKLQNEELSLMLQLLKSEFSEVQSTHADEKAEMDSNGRENESSVIALMEQLEMKNAALVEARSEIEKERENAMSLMRKLQALNVVQEEQQLEEDDWLHKNSDMMLIEESNSSPVRLKEEEDGGGMVIKLKQDLQEMYDTMENLDFDLAEQIYEKSEIELELHIWRSTAEQLRVQLEVNQKMRTQLESSLLEQARFEEVLRADINRLQQIAEDKDRRINYLQEQIALLNSGNKVSGGETNRNNPANTSCLLSSENKYVKKSDANEIELLEQESLRRELEGAILAQIRAERTIEEVMKLSGSSEDLLAIIEKLCDGISNFSGEETTMTGMLGRIVQNIGGERGVDLEGYERCPAKENVNLQLYPLAKPCEVGGVNDRSPFREIN